jgi:hypothetical protein
VHARIARAKRVGYRGRIEALPDKLDLPVFEGRCHVDFASQPQEKRVRAAGQALAQN